MHPIVIDFTPNNLGRVNFRTDFMTGDRLTFDEVIFKLDSGSDFTTLSCEDLDNLGYSEKYLKACKIYGKARTATAGEVDLQYIENVSIKFGNRELQGCRVFFALGSDLHSLFGSDILKYFNYEVDSDAGELRLYKRRVSPALSQGETPIHIYTLEG